MDKILTAFFCAVFLSSLSGCDGRYWPQSEAQQELEELQKNLAGMFKDTDRPMEEIKKLREFEYQVTEVPLEQGRLDYERTLNRLGKDRWDCFHVQEVKEPRPALMFFCKRSPDTPLRFVPGSFTGR